MLDLTNFEGYFFDLDGTILLGDKLLPGASEVVNRLRHQEKCLRFLSNTTTQTAEDCCLRLRSLGLEVEAGEIVTAGQIAAAYLLSHALDPKVLVVGAPALSREMVRSGIEITADPLRASHVLVGMDTSFTYAKLHEAAKAIRAGAVFVAANPDANCPVDGDLLPDTWPLVKSIEAASGVGPHVMTGKPSQYYGAQIMQDCGLAPEACLMIGDRLDTDIAFGFQNGLATALVLTGISHNSEWDAGQRRPDYVWNSLEELVSAFSSVF
ncbi:acid sugar phosphatase [Paenibacillus antibioticophila]|uniref:Acid sugar phosphatase n=1 Tax=Paenibacillus antibioticophila TaxID=1274374 RepID=A0A920CFY5_9BACL|nr:HAD-IIA family hydrolase [Paenibacillus antibioticophila]GIO35514.1 acid sugar phosphatase [Paenibacillus antibioticophila]